MSRPPFTALPFALALLLLAAGCSTLSEHTAERAIARAASTPGGIETIVRFTVKNANPGQGAETGGFYLNSEPDYRDPGSLNILVMPAAAKEFAAAGITDPHAEFVGREILVNGHVRRERIDLFDTASQPAGRHYFQTQIRVSTARQITMAGSNRKPAPHPSIKVATAKPKDYLVQDPDNPIRALYIHDLQKRIDKHFGQELFAARFESGLVVSPGRRIRFGIIVLSDGRLAGDIEELKSRLKNEPQLAVVVIRTLMKITESPTPFPPALIESGQQMIRFDARFAVE